MFGGGLSKNYRGIMVTEEIANTDDLANMARRNVLAKQSSQWVSQLGAQVAEIVSRLHARHFFHNDLKFRNILVTQGRVPQVFMIDCPAGRKFPGRLLERYKVKDIACLDKVARYHFSRTQRLNFFKMYRGKDRLDASDKEFLRKVLQFFEGRE